MSTAADDVLVPLPVQRAATELTGVGAAEPDADAPPQVTIVLPCFNEAGHVAAEVARIVATMDASGLTYDLDVYDDCSTDGTQDVLRGLATRYDRVRLFLRPRNGGSGTIRRIGTENARGEIVVWTDADLTYPNERIPEFVRMLHENDSVDQIVGARTSERGSYKLLRVPAKWFVRKVASHLTDTRIPDLNSGMRAFRRSVAEPYLRLLPAGFSCVTTLTVSFLANGHEVSYVPIDYAKRAGKSKFHFRRDAYLYLLQVLRMVMYFNPLKVLMPVALWIIGLGTVKLVVDVARYDWHVTGSTVLAMLIGFQVAALALIGDLVVRSRR